MTDAEKSAYDRLMEWVDSLFSGGTLRKAAGRAAKKEEWKPPTLEQARKYEEGAKKQLAAEKATKEGLDALTKPVKKKSVAPPPEY